jgi:2-keto-4-pentenoate hydratase/2-oxohepta-3-ene-1,7-dioic acid hydratase in catechol pathway
VKVVRIKAGDDIRYGLADSDGVTIYEGSPFFAWEATEAVVPWDRVQLLAPVIPTKVVAVGRNYADHAAELGNVLPDEPIIFLKPPTSVVGPEAPVVYPADTEELHHEAELAVVIGAVARRVRAEDAGGVVLGYTCANDVSARDLQRRDGQWARAKGFDTFCPLGPAIETELDPLEGLGVRCRVNGELRQEGSTADMVFGVAELIAFASRVMTLLPGDVLLTGTPAGVGPVAPGDVMEVEVDGIGVLRNPVIRE